MNYAIDLGAYTLKYGDNQVFTRYNCMSRQNKEIYMAPESLIGSQEVKSTMEKGVLVDPTLQLQIMQPLIKNIDTNLPIALSCPIYCPTSVRHYYDQIMFEALNVEAYSRVPCAFQGNGLIIDSGFSCTTCLPIFQGFPVNYAARFTNVGGKLLTNLLKEKISFRFYDMSEETWLVSHIKESCCHVSSDFLNDLRAFKKNQIPSLRYQLPSQIGYGQLMQQDLPNAQVLNLGNLRISIPEVLFCPNDAGLEQAGIAETASESILALPETLRQSVAANIICIGGNSLFDGFQEIELRALLPTDIEIKVSVSQEQHKLRPIFQQ